MKIILVILITVFQNEALIPVIPENDSPVLLKILQSVDSVASDEPLFEVALKLLKSVCVCMRETLRQKQEKVNFNGDTNSLQADDLVTDGRDLDIYGKIYNNTCFDLRQELASKINSIQNITIDHKALEEYVNFGNETKNVTHNYNIITKSAAKLDLQNILYKVLIQTKDLHKYSIRRYNLFSKAKLHVRSNLKHSVIIILTLHPLSNKLVNVQEDITGRELHDILHQKSSIDIDIIDAKYDPNERASEEFPKENIVSDCILRSVYTFLIDSEKKKLTKVFKLLRRNGTIKMYIDVTTESNHRDFSRICCNVNTSTPTCKTDLKNNHLTSEQILKNAELSQIKEGTGNYKDTITKIKQLVKLYDKKLQGIADCELERHGLESAKSSECLGISNKNAQENYHTSTALQNVTKEHIRVKTTAFNAYSQVSSGIPKIHNRFTFKTYPEAPISKRKVPPVTINSNGEILRRVPEQVTSDIKANIILNNKCEESNTLRKNISQYFEPVTKVTQKVDSVKHNDSTMSTKSYTKSTSNSTQSWNFESVAFMDNLIRTTPPVKHAISYIFTTAIKKPSTEVETTSEMDNSNKIMEIAPNLILYATSQPELINVPTPDKITSSYITTQNKINGNMTEYLNAQNVVEIPGTLLVVEKIYLQPDQLASTSEFKNNLEMTTSENPVKRNYTSIKVNLTEVNYDIESNSVIKSTTVRIINNYTEMKYATDVKTIAKATDMSVLDTYTKSARKNINTVTSTDHTKRALTAPETQIVRPISENNINCTNTKNKNITTTEILTLLRNNYPLTKKPRVFGVTTTEINQNTYQTQKEEYTSYDQKQLTDIVLTKFKSFNDSNNITASSIASKLLRIQESAAEYDKIFIPIRQVIKNYEIKPIINSKLFLHGESNKTTTIKTSGNNLKTNIDTFKSFNGFPTTLNTLSKELPIFTNENQTVVNENISRYQNSYLSGTIEVQDSTITGTNAITNIIPDITSNPIKSTPIFFNNANTKTSLHIILLPCTLKPTTYINEISSKNQESREKRETKHFQVSETSIKSSPTIKKISNIDLRSNTTVIPLNSTPENIKYKKFRSSLQKPFQFTQDFTATGNKTFKTYGSQEKKQVTRVSKQYGTSVGITYHSTTNKNELSDTKKIEFNKDSTKIIVPNITVHENIAKVNTLTLLFAKNETDLVNSATWATITSPNKTTEVFKHKISIIEKSSTISASCNKEITEIMGDKPTRKEIKKQSLPFKEIWHPFIENKVSVKGKVKIIDEILHDYQHLGNTKKKEKAYTSNDEQMRGSKTNMHYSNIKSTTGNYRSTVPTVFFCVLSTENKTKEISKSFQDKENRDGKIVKILTNYETSENTNTKQSFLGKNTVYPFFKNSVTLMDELLSPKVVLKYNHILGDTSYKKALRSNITKDFKVDIVTNILEPTTNRPIGLKFISIFPFTKRYLIKINVRPTEVRRVKETTKMLKENINVQQRFETSKDTHIFKQDGTNVVDEMTSSKSALKTNISITQTITTGVIIKEQEIPRSFHKNSQLFSKNHITLLHSTTTASNTPRTPLTVTIVDTELRIPTKGVDEEKIITDKISTRKFKTNITPKMANSSVAKIGRYIIINSPKSLTIDNEFDAINKDFSNTQIIRNNKNTTVSKKYTHSKEINGEISIKNKINVLLTKNLTNRKVLKEIEGFKSPRLSIKQMLSFPEKSTQVERDSGTLKAKKISDKDMSELLSNHKTLPDPSNAIKFMISLDTLSDKPNTYSSTQLKINTTETTTALDKTVKLDNTRRLRANTMKHIKHNTSTIIRNSSTIPFNKESPKFSLFGKLNNIKSLFTEQTERPYKLNTLKENLLTMRQIKIPLNSVEGSKLPNYTIPVMINNPTTNKIKVKVSDGETFITSIKNMNFRSIKNLLTTDENGFQVAENFSDLKKHNFSNAISNAIVKSLEFPNYLSVSTAGLEETASNNKTKLLVPAIDIVTVTERNSARSVHSGSIIKSFSDQTNRKPMSYTNMNSGTDTNDILPNTSKYEILVRGQRTLPIDVTIKDSPMYLNVLDTKFSTLKPKVNIKKLQSYETTTNNLSSKTVLITPTQITAKALQLNKENMNKSDYTKLWNINPNTENTMSKTKSSESGYVLQTPIFAIKPTTLIKKRNKYNNNSTTSLFDTTIEPYYAKDSAVENKILYVTKPRGKEKIPTTATRIFKFIESTSSIPQQEIYMARKNYRTSNIILVTQNMSIMNDKTTVEDVNFQIVNHTNLKNNLNNETLKYNLNPRGYKENNDISKHAKSELSYESKNVPIIFHNDLTTNSYSDKSIKNYKDTIKRQSASSSTIGQQMKAIPRNDMKSFNRKNGITAKNSIFSVDRIGNTNKLIKTSSITLSLPTNNNKTTDYSQIDSEDSTVAIINLLALKLLKEPQLQIEDQINKATVKLISTKAYSDVLQRYYNTNKKNTVPFRQYYTDNFSEDPNITTSTVPSSGYSTKYADIYSEDQRYILSIDEIDYSPVISRKFNTNYMKYLDTDINGTKTSDQMYETFGYQTTESSNVFSSQKNNVSLQSTISYNKKVDVLNSRHIPSYKNTSVANMTTYINRDLDVTMYNSYVNITNANKLKHITEKYTVQNTNKEPSESALITKINTPFNEMYKFDDTVNKNNATFLNAYYINSSKYNTYSPYMLTTLNMSEERHSGVLKSHKTEDFSNTPTPIMYINTKQNYPDDQVTTEYQTSNNFNIITQNIERSTNKETSYDLLQSILTQPQNIMTHILIAKQKAVDLESNTHSNISQHDINKKMQNKTRLQSTPSSTTLKSITTFDTKDLYPNSKLITKADNEIVDNISSKYSLEKEEIIVTPQNPYYLASSISTFNKINPVTKDLKENIKINTYGKYLNTPYVGIVTERIATVEDRAENTNVNNSTVIDKKHLSDIIFDNITEKYLTKEYEITPATIEVTSWWLDDMYLKVRLPLPINSNPGMVFPRRKFAKMEEVADLGALFIDDLLDYKEMLDRGELPLERATSREKGQPLCMEQFYRLLGVCRIPEVGRDRLELPLVKNGPEELEELIIVACRNYFYPIPVKALDRGRLTPGEIQAQILHAMVDASGAAPAPRVGLLTSMNRDQWARAREQVIKDESNRANLELISRALCILCVDEAGGDRADTDEQTNAMLRAMHGAGTRHHSANRWFDKTVQLIISSDGTVGMCYEHSAAEGVAVIRLAERALARAEVADRPAPPPALLPAPQAMKWTVTGDVQRTIEQAARDLDRAISDLDFKVYTYRGYGREFMKSCKTSPDVYIQLALQYAYYKMYGYLVTTYESASLRRFRNGRVDNIRSAHNKARAWAAAMCTAETPPLNESNDDGQKKVSFNLYGEQKKLELFEEAARKQTSIMEANILGRGIDNHLLGLREAARESMGQLPHLFTDDTYKQMIHFKLSTSQVATTTEGTFMGYGAVVPDGYGCSYNPKKDCIIFCISSFTSSSVTNTEAFRQSLEEALDSMKLMFQARKVET